MLFRAGVEHSFPRNSNFGKTLHFFTFFTTKCVFLMRFCNKLSIFSPLSIYSFMQIRGKYNHFCLFLTKCDFRQNHLFFDIFPCGKLCGNCGKPYFSRVSANIFLRACGKPRPKTLSRAFSKIPQNLHYAQTRLFDLKNHSCKIVLLFFELFCDIIF